MVELGSSFHTDSIITETLFGDSSKQGPVAPERELMLAVLADAVECFCKHSASRDGIGMRLFQEAQEWIFDESEQQPFSFLNVCAALNLDPAYIRRGVLNWKGRELGQRRDGRIGQRDFHLKNVKRSSRTISRRRKTVSRQKPHPGGLPRC